MRFVIVLISGLLLFVGGIAQPSGWEVDPRLFAYNMTITGVVKLNYEEVRDSQDYVAAFVGNECRGVAKLTYNADVDRYFAYLMVYSNQFRGEQISFKVYNAQDGKIYEIEKTLEFVADTNIGTVLRPYVWSFPTLSSEAKFLSYWFENQIDSTEFVDSIIKVIMPFGTDVTNLIANFEVPPMTQVFVGDSLQQSGITANDFSEPVIYRILSADESNEAYYAVIVEVLEEFQAQVKAANFFSPNGDGINDYWIIAQPELYKDCEIIVFNRFGQVVYRSIGYEKPWDGTINGKPLPIGTYMFVIKCPYCENCIYKGTVTIIR